jgi:hypothetical protein
MEHICALVLLLTFWFSAEHIFITGPLQSLNRVVRAKDGKGLNNLGYKQLISLGLSYCDITSYFLHSQ